METTTSIESNESQIEGKTLIDVPSSGDLSRALRGRLGPGARLCFLVRPDAPEALYQAAGLLYRALISAEVARSSPEIRILRVLPCQLSLADFEKGLLRELDRLKVSRRSSVNSENAEEYLLEFPGGFDWSHVRAKEVKVQDLDTGAKRDELLRQILI